MKTLVLDNYDSFTYNLFQLIGEVNGVEPLVVRNDEARWAELTELDFDNVVISAGPGSAARDRDFGICAEAIRLCDRPLLGVCLGHQGIALAAGGRVAHAPEVVHGRTSQLRHNGSPLFEGMPDGFAVTRYHSLCVEPDLPRELEAIAWADEGLVMALAHRNRPQWGVQFHPESIGTEHGAMLLSNFQRLTRGLCRRSAARREPPSPRGGSASPPARAAVRSEGAELVLLVEAVELAVDAERAFPALYGESSHAFWLDGAQVGSTARFSFFGDASGPLARVVEADVRAGEIVINEPRSGRRERRRESIFDYLAAETRRLRLSSPALPFDFNCGFVGYLGYELKEECGGARAHASPFPDAVMLFADRLVAIDHVEGRCYALALARAGDESEARAWLAATRRRLRALPEAGGPPGPDGADLEFRLDRSRAGYLAGVRECKRQLAAGETYEICLTDRLRGEAALEPLSAFLALRRQNPAPYSAYLRFGERSVLSSSPERFLRIGRDRSVEAKPIKGTQRRAADPRLDRSLAAALAASEKERAESLMVTDLLRNDLGRVCELGTVTVPGPAAVETWETVHHLVATVRGRLRAGLGPVDCVRACFPPGSMTGVPKRRTMEIIDRLEGRARGVYSGALGYFGLCGAADMSVVIRTAVMDGRSTEIGVGGAVVALSEPEAEYREALLKGEAAVRALGGSLSEW